MADRGLDCEQPERLLDASGRLPWVLLGADVPEWFAEAPQSVLQLDVIGTPKPQGSKRHVGRGILIESCRELKPWRESITAAAIAAGIERIEGPVWVDLMFRFDRPKTHFGARGLKPSAPAFKTTKPDTDKLTRAVLDALLPVWRDDAQVVGLMAQKRWCNKQELPGVGISVWAG